MCTWALVYRHLCRANCPLLEIEGEPGRTMGLRDHLLVIYVPPIIIFSFLRRFRDSSELTCRKYPCYAITSFDLSNLNDELACRCTWVRFSNGILTTETKSFRWGFTPTADRYFVQVSSNLSSVLAHNRFSTAPLSLSLKSVYHRAKCKRLTPSHLNNFLDRLTNVHNFVRRIQRSEQRVESLMV